MGANVGVPEVGQPPAKIGHGDPPVPADVDPAQQRHVARHAPGPYLLLLIPVRGDRIRRLAISVTLASPVRCCLPLGVGGAGVFASVSATLPEGSAATGR